LLVKLAALMLKNVARLSVASAFASIVLPLPGGPYSRMPRTGARSPENMSARSLNHQQQQQQQCSHSTISGSMPRTGVRNPENMSARSLEQQQCSSAATA
jgi:hypothetical protein